MQQLAELMGKPIQSEEIKKFFEENGIKYPKKDTISNKANDRDLWVVDKKSGFEFLFSIEIYNCFYPPVKGERKGVFVPRLKTILFREKAKIDYPAGINLNSTLDELKSKLGEPTSTNKSRLGEFQTWKIPAQEQRAIIFGISFDVDENSIFQLWLSIQEEKEVMELYDPLSGSTSENITKFQNSFYKKKNLFFINWALKNNFLLIDTAFNNLLAQFKAGEINIVDFATQAFAKKYYIAVEDFKDVDTKFISDYINNLSKYDIVYQRDFAYTFLKDEALRDNYLGEKAFIEMSKIEYSPGNLKLIEDVINQRYKEYKEHGFSGSEKELKPKS